MCRENPKDPEFLVCRQEAQVKYRHIKCIDKDVDCSVSLSVKTLDPPPHNCPRVLFA